MLIIYNYPPKGRWIVVDIYRDAKRRGIYPPLFTDPEGDSCFSDYQIRWIIKCRFNFFFLNFREMTRHFSLRSQNSEYPRIFRVTGVNQNARKLLSTDLVNTNSCYFLFWSAEEDGPELPTKADQEFRPFIRRLPEFKFWWDLNFFGIQCAIFVP